MARKGSLGLTEALKVPAWGLEGLAPIFPYVKVGLPPTIACEVVGLLWKGFHPQDSIFFMCDVVYEVLATLVETGVWNIGAGIPPLKSEKGELMNGAKTRV